MIAIPEKSVSGLSLGGLAILVLLAGCDNVGGRAADPPVPAPAPATGSPASAPAASFRSELTDDISGYYMPMAGLRSGNWALRNVFVGQSPDFSAWESGARSGTFAPIMLEFEDVTSPMIQTELGEVRSGQVRVLPSRYEVSDDRLMFEGLAEGIGPVRLSGRLDGEALATSRRNLGDEGAVLTGDLVVGNQTFTGASFRWWAGD